MRFQLPAQAQACIARHPRANPCTHDARPRRAVNIHPPTSLTDGLQIFGLAYFPDGRRIAVAEGEDYGKPEGMRGQNVIVVLDVDTCTELRRMSGHESIVYSVALSPDGSTIASGAADNTIRLWNVDGSSLAVLRAHNSRVHAVAFHPNGHELASVSGNGKLGGVPGPDNTVRLWTWEQ